MALPIDLARARSLVRVHDRPGRLHHRGYEWVRTRFLPCLRRLEQAVRASDRRLAAQGWRELGRAHDLNGTPRAAMRAYQRWLALEPTSVDAWRAIAAMHEAMGEYSRARLALLYARRIDPNHEGAALELERVLWLSLEKFPSIYEARSVAWRAREELAAGRGARALRLLARRRAPQYRQLRARVFGARGDVERLLGEWRAIANGKEGIRLQFADWFYTFQGKAGEDPRLWRLLLWQVRPKLETTGFYTSPTLGELGVSELKRYELHVRFQLACAEEDVSALLALARSYPSWREPGEAALRLVPHP
jgi:tetratricopeptide (TPR) repeat protein